MARGGGTGSRATKKKKADAGTAAPAQQNGVDRENKNVSDADKHQTTQKHRKQKVKFDKSMHFIMFVHAYVALLKLVLTTE